MLKDAGGHFTVGDLKRIAGKQRNRCADCRVSFKKSPATIDHIIAITRGGSNHPRNIQLLCMKCNQRKGNKDPIVYAAEIGRLL